MDNNTNRNTNRNNPKNDRDNKNQKKNQIIGIVVALVAAFLFTTLSSYIVDSMTTKEISYNQFIALLENNNVESVVFNNNKIEITPKDNNGNIIKVRYWTTELNDPELIQELKEKIWDINNNEALIHYDYLMEGMQLDDIFYEIYQSRFNKIYNEKCFAKYEEYINPVRKAIQIYESDKSFDREEIRKRIFISRSVKELNNLLKQETYLYKCKKSDDIRFGDILKLKNSYYMVVTQDCDLSIRLEEKRKNDCINLIKVKYLDNNLKNIQITSKLEGIYKNTYAKQGNDSYISNIKEIIFDNIEPFDKLNIDKTKIENILNTDRVDQEDLPLLNKSIELSSDNKFYLIEDIFIYCILLNCQDSDRIEITKESIEKSKEIRVATKNYIKERFDKLIRKYSKLQYESLKEISDKKLISDLIPIEFSFDEENKLIGLFVDKDKILRVGHLDYIKAYDIFKEFMSKYSRFSYNSPPLI